MHPSNLTPRKLGSEDARSSVSKTPSNSSTYCNPARYNPTTSFGIGSVSVTAPLPSQKSRHLSSAYRTISPHTTRLIIGGCSTASVIGRCLMRGKFGVAFVGIHPPILAISGNQVGSTLPGVAGKFGWESVAFVGVQGLIIRYGQLSCQCPLEITHCVVTDFNSHGCANFCGCTVMHAVVYTCTGHFLDKFIDALPASAYAVCRDADSG